MMSNYGKLRSDEIDIIFRLSDILYLLLNIKKSSLDKVIAESLLNVGEDV